MLSKLLILLSSASTLVHAVTLDEWLKHSSPSTQQQNINPILYQQFYQAQQHLEKKQSQTALIELQQINSDIMSAHEIAIREQYLAYAYSANQQYPQAIQAFEKALASEAFSQSDKLKMANDLAALYIKTSQYLSAAKLKQQLFRYQIPSDTTRIETAALYYQAGDCAQTLQVLSKIKTPNTDKKNDATQLQLACYQTLNKHKEYTQLLQQLLSYNSKDFELWHLLIGTYQRNNQPHQALASMLSAYQVGFYQGRDDIYRIADFYTYLKQPINAAGFLENAAKQKKISKDSQYWHYLSDSYIAAKQRQNAIKALKHLDVTQAETSLKIAALQQEQDDWAGVLSTLDKVAFSQSQLQQQQIYLLQGTGYYFTQEFDKARQYLTQAANINADPKLQQQAQQWLNYLQQVANP